MGGEEVGRCTTMNDGYQSGPSHIEDCRKSNVRKIYIKGTRSHVLALVKVRADFMFTLFPMGHHLTRSNCIGEKSSLSLSLSQKGVLASRRRREKLLKFKVGHHGKCLSVYNV